MDSLLKYFSLPPEELTQDDIRNYMIYLVKERGLAPASCRLQLNGIRFFYSYVLHWPPLALEVQYPGRPPAYPGIALPQ
jgi:integrase/recombinase XerD